jgi:hypothetical protein
LDKTGVTQDPKAAQSATGAPPLPTANTISAVPEKFICRKSRTTYTTPTNFTAAQMQISATPPACRIKRRFVYGLQLKSLYSGPAFHCLKAAKEDRSRVVVYAASALGVIHNLSTNDQVYFDGHTDEITCLSVDPSGTYVVSGQIGINKDVCSDLLSVCMFIFSLSHCLSLSLSLFVSLFLSVSQGKILFC